MYIPDIRNVRFLDELLETKIDLSEIILCGSAVLTLYGVRPNMDLDIFVSMHVWLDILGDDRFSYRRIERDNIDVFSYGDNIDFHHENWPFNNSFDDELRNNTMNFNGYNFFKPERLLEWKLIVNRPKDQADIEALNKIIEQR